ncbi:MAG TPA: hypothetical protein VNA24_23360, partial [Hyalangium sp.]|nr:hypothetical protein [Hyalangium sp.]
MAWLFSGCGQEERLLPAPGEAPAPTAEPRQVSAPFDVQKVMDQVHFAFRPRGLAWEGGHSTYEVQVGADGFSVTPYHHLRSQPEEAEGLRSSQEQNTGRTEAPSHAVVKGSPMRFGAAQVSRGGTALSSHKAQG